MALVISCEGCMFTIFTVALSCSITTSYLMNTPCVLHGQHQNTDIEEGHLWTRYSYITHRLFLKKKEQWRKQDKWSKSMKHYRSTMYSVERVWVDILKQSYHFLTKSKARHHRTTLTTRGGRGGGKWWAEMRELGGSGGDQRDIWYVHVCKPLQVSQ